MLSRRFRVVGVLAVATVLLMMLVRSYGADYSYNQLPIPDNWLLGGGGDDNSGAGAGVVGETPQATGEKVDVKTESGAEIETETETETQTTTPPKENEEGEMHMLPVDPDDSKNVHDDPQLKPPEEEDATAPPSDDAPLNVHDPAQGTDPPPVTDHGDPTFVKSEKPPEADSTTEDGDASNVDLNSPHIDSPSDDDDSAADNDAEDETQEQDHAPGDEAIDNSDAPNSTDSHFTLPASHGDDPPSPDKVDWSRFAYTQYVTDADYLCNSVMIFETLHRLGARADLVMMYPEYMLSDPTATLAATQDGKLILKARDEYNVKLAPIEVQHREGDGLDSTWLDSYTKLLAFNQTQYDRCLSLDSDGTVLQPMDELFLLPSSPVAMPRAYWLFGGDKPEKILSSQVLLVEPSAAEFARIQKKIDSAGVYDYDMEIVNDLYLNSALVLPHRKYDLLTGEFRHSADDHAMYLGSTDEVWDADLVLNEAKYLHFSDWPVPKPWIPMEEDMRNQQQPDCQLRDGKESCTEREMWNGFYTDFTERRERVCKVASDKRSVRKRSLRTEASRRSHMQR